MDQIDWDHTMEFSLNDVRAGLVKRYYEHQLSQTTAIRKITDIGKRATMSDLLGPQTQYLPLVISNPVTAVIKTTRKVRKDGKTLTTTVHAGGRALKAVLGCIISLCIPILVMTLLLFARDHSENNHIFGYSIFSVQSESMNSVIPQGSAIITQWADPDDIQAGDIITFRSGETTVTHRVEGVYENYDGNTLKGFRTKGDDNGKPDVDIVTGNMVIGVVRAYIPVLGLLIAIAEDNNTVIMLATALLTTILCAIRMGIGKRPRRSGWKEKTQEDTLDGIAYQEISHSPLAV